MSDERVLAEFAGSLIELGKKLRRLSRGGITVGTLPAIQKAVDDLRETSEWLAATIATTLDTH